MKWINVNDELPVEGDKVLVFNTALKRPTIGWYRSGGWNEMGYPVGCDIGFWMPLPGDPEDFVRGDTSQILDANGRDNFTNIAFKVTF